MSGGRRNRRRGESAAAGGCCAGPFQSARDVSITRASRKFPLIVPYLSAQTRLPKGTARTCAHSGMSRMMVLPGVLSLSQPERDAPADGDCYRQHHTQIHADGQEKGHIPAPLPIISEETGPSGAAPSRSVTPAVTGGSSVERWRGRTRIPTVSYPHVAHSSHRRSGPNRRTNSCLQKYSSNRRRILATWTADATTRPGRGRRDLPPISNVVNG